jgi:hypothetical protein
VPTRDETNERDERPAGGPEEARRRRLGLVGGLALLSAIAAIGAAALAAAGGGDAGRADGTPAAHVPAPRIDDLAAAARAARCTVAEHPIEGREHTTAPVRYRTNPPTSGPHDPVPAPDGIHPPGEPPDLEQTVHALEHGRVLIQYRPGTPSRRIAQLEAIVREPVKGEPGYHTLLFENQTGMRPALAVTAWGVALTCDAWNDRVFDAIRAFRRERVDRGPEFVP